METNGHRRDDDALAALIEDDAQMDRLAREAVFDALRLHKERGQSVVVWRDGQIVTLTPDQIPDTSANGEPE